MRAAPLTCDSKQQLYSDGPVRIFLRTVGNIERFYCAARGCARPRLFLEKNP